MGLMSYQLHQQCLDLDSGFHVIELRDEHGRQHLLQLALGHDVCVACGSVTPKDNLGELDPKALIAAELERLNASHAAMMEYAAKHGLKVK